MPPSTVDVLIVGLGPVGSALGLLLASSPRKPRVHVIERHASPYPLPRAVHLDGEALRILARIGCTSFGESETTTSYEWVNENGELLLRIPPDTEEGDLMFSQPFLERHLLELAGRHPNLSHEWGRELVALQDKGDHVVATTRKFIEGSDRMDGVQEVHAKFVVGCDGAQSTVRKLLGIEMEDLQFFFDWLITDVLLDEPRVWEPMNLQICTPTRPTTVVSGGSPQRRRWEFMGLPGESAADLNKESKAWELLKPFDVHSGNAKLEKSAVYRFQAKWGKEWGKGRCWLAGDAAHLMPPFAGQGLCSGLRDALNLSFKILHLLDLPTASPSFIYEFLSTYSSERSAHVQHAIWMSIELGNVICITDRSKAAERDARMLGKNGDPRLVLPPPKPEVLGSGLLQGDGAGRYLRQAAVKTVSGDGKFDGVVGMGWVLMGWVLIALDDVKLSLGAQKVWEKLGGKIARLLPKSSAPRSNALVDAAGRYHSAIRQLRKDAKFAIVRPDWYVYGLAKDQVELEGLLEKLGRQMFPDSARL